MKLNKKWITGLGAAVLAIVVIAIISGASARRKEAAKHNVEVRMTHENAPRPIRYEEVRAEPLSRDRSFPGFVKASEETALSFRVGGPLTEVNVVLGEPVKKGDLLMQIDPRDFEDRILSLEAQLDGAAARLENARQDYRRTAELFEEKVVPQADYDRAKSAMDSAEAAVKNVEVQLQIARHALEDTALRAPYDGTVTAQRVENHEMITPGAVVLQYHAIDDIEIVVQVPENEAANAPMDTDGIFAFVTFPALRGQEFKADLKEWSTQADPTTRTYTAVFEMKAPTANRILPGMTATVTFRESFDRSPVVTVPVSALTSAEDGASRVWVYDAESGRVEARTVQTGGLNGASRMVVSEGLSAGERVVVSGSRFLHAGRAVRAIND
ncbi:efflux RND transporter periplasmic adaptor subunit [Pontiella sp.]|uniref:efflux RND transporter periplasmic adaptor subunit n=1 Tax=Pontiella sp. TaxID=2837462 RepID=UPI003564DF6C